MQRWLKIDTNEVDLIFAHLFTSSLSSFVEAGEMSYST